MAYDGRILARANDALKQRVAEHEEELNNRLQKIAILEPEIAAIGIKMRRSIIGVINSALSSNSDVALQVKMAQNDNKMLRRRRSELLTDLGFPPDYLDRQPLCPVCGDSGYTDNGMCSCLKTLYCRELAAQLRVKCPLPKTLFSDFRPELYSDELRPGQRTTVRENMLYNIHICREFVADERSRQSLFFSGAPGTGKTFLAAATAYELCAKGEYVIYTTASDIFAYYEDERFRRLEDAKNEIRRFENCDVLVIDDLGAERVSAQNASSLYQLINVRLGASHPTIISTNLSFDEISKRYGAAAASRIGGDYRTLYFRGEDLRYKRNVSFL